ncbi:MAG: response regulator transcription factor [Candidatus Cloacimonetes bacterium]|nr:response regulator transcription factor [Candidatus Cloacimonadota bacterium]
MTNKFNVYIVDDHPIVRIGLVELINGQADLCVCGQAEDGITTLRDLRSLKVDVILLDLSLKGIHGLDLIKEIVSRYENMKIIVLSMYSESLYAEKVMELGAHGYITKDEVADKLLVGMRTVINGSPFLSESLLKKLAYQKFNPSSPLKGCSTQKLSKREFEVMSFVGDGLTTKEISVKMGIKPKTIETYKERLKAKLKLKSVSELIKTAILMKKFD